MSMAYPMALFGLLSIPVLLVIHALYRKKKREKVSTLFLIQEIAPHNPKGIRIKRVINNPSLWLQILALLLAIWLALGMQWKQFTDQKKVAIVLDASTSMLAFFETLPEKIEEVVDELGLESDNVEWSLVSSHLEDPVFYKGDSFSQLLSSIHKSCFTRGLHDSLASLDEVKFLVGDHGEIIYITDHDQVVSDEIHFVSIGIPLTNVGFAGSDIGRNENGVWGWEVLVRNASEKMAKRDLFMDGEKLETLLLDPNEVRSIKGSFRESNWIELSLSQDEYDFDDSVLLTKPSLKLCQVQLSLDSKQNASLKNQLQNIYSAFEFGGDKPATLDIGLFKEVKADRHRIYFYPPEVKVKSSPLACMNQDHELVRNLSWQRLGMTLEQLGAASLNEGDQVLVWFEQVPLMILRHQVTNEGDWRELHFNFNYHEELWKIPSFSILMFRFLNSVIDVSPGFEAKNLAVPSVLNYYAHEDERLTLTWDESNSEIKELKKGEVLPINLSPSQTKLVIKSSEQELRRYAFQSVDAREGDFKKSVEIERLSSLKSGVQKLEVFKADPYVPIWIFMIFSALGYDWYLRRRRS